MNSMIFWPNKESSLLLTLEQCHGLGTLHSSEPHPLIVVWDILARAHCVRMLQQLVKRQQRVTVSKQLTAVSKSRHE